MTAPTVDQPTETGGDDTGGYTGGMIALIPADPYPLVLAVSGGLPPEQLHLTLAYLGDDVTGWTPEFAAAVRGVVQQITGAVAWDDDMLPVPDSGPGQRGPLTLTVFAHSNFNPTGAGGWEPCMVYQFSGDGDLPMVEALASEVQHRVKDAIGEINFPEQHARFEPHITAGYGLAPDALTYVGPVVFDRVRVALGNDYTDIPLGGDNTMTAAAPTPVNTGSPATILSDTGAEIKVHWDALAVEGLDTGDGRYLTPGGGTHRTTPLSLLALPYAAHGGADAPAAEVFGEITNLTRHPGPEVTSKRTGEPFPDGTFVWSADATIDGTHKYADMVRKGHLRGGSVDLADLDAELIDDETAAMSENPRRRAVLTRYEIAAATMVPVPAFADAYCDVVDSLPAALAASALPVELWKEPVPMWRSSEVGDPIAPLTASLIAAGAVPRPPLSCFTDPGLTEETPITIEDIPGSPYKHVYGHIGSRSRPHIGFGGQRVYIPRSKCDYAEFMRGGFRVDDNGTPRIVAVGHLTADTGHADLAMAASSAARFYDHTGFAWADVAAGDDNIGVWVNGVTKLGLTDEQLDRALSHPPSGDWRPIGGSLEMVAVLCVNTPGFGVYRARVASGQVQAMVASSGLPPRRAMTDGSTIDYDQLADVIVDRILTKQQQSAALTARRTAALAATDDNTARMAELLAEIPDETTDDESFALINADVLASFLAGREVTPKDAANTARLKEYWSHGPGAAKIRWGQPSDFNRCRTHLAKYVPPGGTLDGLCANLHHDALGVWPGREHGKK